jgi:hypothetical protein
MSQLPCSTLAADRQTTLQETGLSALTDARYSDWLKDRPYRNALDLSVLSMKPQMVKARLADSSKVSPPARARRCPCTATDKWGCGGVGGRGRRRAACNQALQ